MRKDHIWVMIICRWRDIAGNTDSIVKAKKVSADKEQCHCAQMFKIKLTKTNLQTCYFFFIYLFSKDNKDLLRESPLKMVTEWLGQYVQNSPGLM